MRRQKVKRKVKSLLEKQSICRKTHGQTQKVGCTFGKFKSFITVQFSRSLSSFWPIIALFPLANLSQDLPLGAHAPLSQDGSRRKGAWGKQDSLWPGVVP